MFSRKALIHEIKGTAMQRTKQQRIGTLALSGVLELKESVRACMVYILMVECSEWFRGSTEWPSVDPVHTYDNLYTVQHSSPEVA
jgi:hypothetical protein